MKYPATQLKKVVAIILCGMTLVLFNLQAQAQSDDDDILDLLPPIIAATSSSSCKGGVGTVQNNEISIDATDFSRNFGASVGTFQGFSTIRFGTGASGSTRVEYDICVPATGKYQVFLRTYAEGHTNNGLFIGVNGQLQRALPDHPLAGSTAIYVFKYVWGEVPQWLQKPSDKHSGPVEILLEEGLQTFELRKRLIERPYINTIRLLKTG